jgi:hypothetical protein
MAAFIVPAMAVLLLANEQGHHLALGPAHGGGCAITSEASTSRMGPRKVRPFRAHGITRRAAFNSMARRFPLGSVAATYHAPA